MALLPIPFGNPYTYKGHTGVDFPQPRGTAFRASGPGRVTSIDFAPRPGNTVWVKYNNGPLVGYAHMDHRTTDVFVGKYVEEGTVLGRVGSLGTYSTGPHLHVEVDGHATTAGFWSFFDPARVVGQGSGAGENTTPSTPGTGSNPGGFLMALSDKDQALLFERVNAIFAALYGTRNLSDDPAKNTNPEPLRWYSKDGARSANYGLLDVDIYSQELIAKLLDE